MDLIINSDYNYITFIDSFYEVLKDKDENIIGGPHKIIMSPQINHELLAMMFARNFNDDKVTIDQMVYGSLTEEEIIALSRVGCMQFDMHNSQVKLYEFKSLLNTIELTVIDVPKNAVFIAFQKELTDEPYLVDISKFTLSKKLLMMATSSKKIDNVSQEIHNNMLFPHNMIDDFVLFTKDLTKYQSLMLIDENNIDIQARVKLGEIIHQYEDTGDTQYLKGIWDRTDGKYIYSVNEHSIKLS